MMKQKSLFSLLIAFLLAIVQFLPMTNHFARAAGAEPTHIVVTYYDGPYTRGFTWQTDLGFSGGEVQLIEKTDAMTKKNIDWSSDSVIKLAATAEEIEYIDGTFLSWKAYYDFTAEADGKTFFYRLGSSNAWSAVGEQKIDGGNDGVYMIHVADPQGRTEGVFNLWDRTLKAAMQQFPQAQNIMFSGDWIQEGNENIQWGYALNKVQSTFLDTVVTPAAGNHDFGGKYCTPERLNARFYIHMAEGAGLNFYYSYDIGNVHVTVLNTNTPEWNTGRISPEEVEWLIEDLELADANPNIRWKVVQQHAALISVGKYTYETSGSNGNVKAYTMDLRRDLMPIYSQFKVDLVLQGHEHVYTRSKPIAWNATVADWGAPKESAATGYEVYNYNYFGTSRQYMENPNGTMYVVVGPAGGSRRQEVKTVPEIDALIGVHPETGEKMAVQPEPWTYEDRGQKGMFGAISIKDGNLLYETYVVDGNKTYLLDYFGIVKDVPEYELITPATSTTTAPSEGEEPDKTIVTSGKNFTASIEWKDIPDEGYFDYETAYKAVITLKAESGYGFDTNTDLAAYAVNGITPTLVSRTKGVLILEVTFPETEKPAMPIHEKKGCETFKTDSGGLMMGGLLLALISFMVIKRKQYE